MSVSRNIETSSADDEISLLDIWAFLFRNRLLIATSLLVALLAGIAYAFFGPKRYSMEVMIYPPYPEELTALNLALSPHTITGIEPITPEFAFGFAARTMRKERTTQIWFRDVFSAENEGLGGSLGGAEFLSAKTAMVIKRPDERRGTTDWGIKSFSEAPERTADLVRGYLSIVSDLSSRELKSVLAERVRLALADVDEQIAAARDLTKAKTEDRLVQLREALAIAEASGIAKPLVLSERLPKQDRLKHAAENESLYTLGSANLKSEIREINARQDNDAFIGALRDLELKKAYLQRIDLAPIPLETFLADREIVAPEVGQPRKLLVLVVAGLLGLCLGLGLAMLKEFVRLAKTRPAFFV